MDIRSKFSAQEWAKIESAPFLVGSATALATNSGMIGTYREFNTLREMVNLGVQQYPNNRLILAIMPDSEYAPHASNESVRRELEDQESQRRSGSEEAELALTHLQEAVRLLKGVATDVELEQYKYWIRTIGRRVAEIAKEGGIFERGVDPISKEEAAFLAKVDLILDQVN